MTSLEAMLLPRCPHCSSVDFRNVGTRNAMERALFWILRPCRCGLCGRHFFLSRWQAAAGESA